MKKGKTLIRKSQNQKETPEKDVQEIPIEENNSQNESSQEALDFETRYSALIDTETQGNQDEDIEIVGNDTEPEIETSSKKKKKKEKKWTKKDERDFQSRLSKHKRERPVELPKAIPQKLKITDLITDIKQRSKRLEIKEDIKTKTPKLRSDKIVQNKTDIVIQISDSDTESDLELEVVQCIKEDNEKVEDTDESIIQNVPRLPEEGMEQVGEELEKTNKEIEKEESEIQEEIEEENTNKEIEKEESENEGDDDDQEEEKEDLTTKAPNEPSVDPSIEPSIEKPVEKPIEKSVEISLNIGQPSIEESTLNIEKSVEIPLPSEFLEEKENITSLNEEYSGDETQYSDNEEEDVQQIQNIKKKSFNLKDLPRFKHHRGLIMSTISQSAPNSQEMDEKDSDDEKASDEEEKISERMERGYKIKKITKESLSSSISILPSFHEEEDRTTFEVKKNEPKKRKREKSSSNLAVKFAQNYKKDDEPIREQVKTCVFTKQKSKKKKIE